MTSLICYPSVRRLKRMLPNSSAKMSAGLVSRDLLSSSETLREMEIAVEQGNTAAYGRFNRRFHLLIYDSAEMST